MAFPLPRFILPLCLRRRLRSETTLFFVRQVRHGLRSKHWDTRVAAGECLGLISAHCEHHTAADLQAASGVSDAVKAAPDGHANGVGPADNDAGREAEAPLSFRNFRIEQVMEKGSLLLASGGTVRCKPVSATQSSRSVCMVGSRRFGAASFRSNGTASVTARLV